MTFSRFVCWDPVRVHTVMNTRAEYARDDVFLAVHTNRDLRLRQRDQPNVRAQDLRSWTELPEEFLQKFLEPRAQARVAVLGDSGSGKSHLIHWMKLRIPETATRRVITVNKSRINLRSVLEMIIAELPESRRADYTAKLNEAGQHTYDTAQRREQLLSQIARAIGRDKPASADPRERGIEQMLIEELPGLFDDPVLRRDFWRGDDTIIARLVTHLEGSNLVYERRKEAQQFALADLPFSDKVLPAKTAETTRELLSDLRANRKEQEWSLAIINRNLSNALAALLNFTGDQLITLMEEVRSALYAERKELVLLIEDFARLQGVDQALLQALTVESGPGENKLCTLRWAMAVTGGYYAQLDATAKTRMTAVVEMDLTPEFGGGTFGEPTLARFAVRYLNAARLTEEQLAGWHEAGADPADLPNACERCPYRPECHDAFGATNGIGHYPFTQHALWEMGQRANPRIAETFNPRSLIDEVLVEVLNLRSDDLREGRFPPHALLDRLGGTRLDASVRFQLDRNDPDNAPRQETALNLWGNPPHAVKLPDGLYTAFDLPAPELDGHVAPPGVSPPVPPPPTHVDPVLHAVEEWGRGNLLKYTHVGALRDLIYDALESHVDWDAAGLERSSFSQKTGYSVPFKSANILLRNQETPPQANAQSVVLAIPVRDDPAALRDAAIAVRGLVLFKRTGSWDFDGAHLALATLAAQLESWSTELVRLLLAWSTRDNTWNPTRAAVEVLAVGAAMAGKLAESHSTAEALNAIFDPWPETSGGGARAWKDLYTEIYKAKGALEEVLRARASSMKGGQAGFFLDVARVLPAMRQVRDGWQLAASPPPGLDQGRSAVAQTARLHARVQGQLAAVAREEFKRREEWLQKVRGQVPSGVRRAEVVEELRKTMDAVAGRGIAVSPAARSALRDALDNFEGTQFDAAVRTAEDLARAESPLKALSALGRTQPAAVELSEALLVAAERYLQDAQQSLTLKRQELQAQAGTDLAGDKQRIADALRRLDGALGQLEGGA